MQKIPNVQLVSRMIQDALHDLPAGKTTIEKKEDGTIVITGDDGNVATLPSLSLIPKTTDELSIDGEDNHIVIISSNKLKDSGKTISSIDNALTQAENVISIANRQVDSINAAVKSAENALESALEVSESISVSERNAKAYGESSARAASESVEAYDNLMTSVVSISEIINNFVYNKENGQWYYPDGELADVSAYENRTVDALDAASEIQIRELRKLEINIDDSKKKDSEYSETELCAYLGSTLENLNDLFSQEYRMMHVNATNNNSEISIDGVVSFGSVEASDRSIKTVSVSAATGNMTIMKRISDETSTYTVDLNLINL